MGHAGHDRARAGARAAPGQEIRPARPLLGSPARAPSPGASGGRGRSDHAGAPARARSDQVLRLRGRRREREGSLELDLALAPQRRQVGARQDHRDPGGAGRPEPAPPRAPAVQGGAAAGERHRPLGRRPLPLRVLLGDGRAPTVRRVGPVPPAANRQHPPGRDRAARAPSALGAAQRRTADGGSEPRRAPGVFHQLALRRLGRPVLSRRHSRMDGQGGRAPHRGHGAGPDVLPGVRGRAPTPGTAPGRRRVVRLVLLCVSPAGVWSAAALGAFHGLNPAMGWLFAVALGLQDRRRSAVLAALVPIAVGHAASVALVGIVLAAAGFAIPARALRLAAGGVLVAFGGFRLARPFAHPRWVGMRVGFTDLVLWSFLMASAHGAGLMLAPVFFGLPGPAGSMHASGGLAILAAHTAAMFLVMGSVALVVYESVGLELVRRAWVNLELVCGVSLVLAGAVMLLA